MSFSSFTFLIRFLPIALLLYYLCPNKGRNALLVFLSLLFYSWGSPSSLPVLLIIAFIGYIGGLLLFQHNKFKKSILAIALILIFGSLGFYKYLAFFCSIINSAFLESLGAGIAVPDIAAPLGISFFSFTISGYLIDIYKNESNACKNPVDYLLFVSFFPKLLMGPIVRYKDIEKQIRERVVRFDQLEPGSFKFICGLAKKVLLADGIAKLWNEVLSLGLDKVSTPLAWLGVIAYSFQLYFDFSGYSDMASGLGLLFGFRLPENFNYPYSSKSATEFWRRWHITMGGWFKQYVYFPLGGSRCSRPRMIFNTLVVWILTGLWHGAAWNFILWGLYYFVILMLEKNVYGRLIEKSSLLSHLYTIIITLIGWAVFSVSDFRTLLSLFTALFGFRTGIGSMYILRNYAVLLLICSIMSFESTGKLIARLSQKPIFRIVVSLILLILSIAYLTDATYQPFLYAQF